MKQTLKATAAVIGMIAAVAIAGIITSHAITAAENVILFVIN
ncbi:hypothetical protein [uncultured Muribaculum sp.]|nr:hypothetical protein [uncultured Muribaculum sp.]